MRFENLAAWEDYKTDQKRGREGKEAAIHSAVLPDTATKGGSFLFYSSHYSHHFSFCSYSSVQLPLATGDLRAWDLASGEGRPKRADQAFCWYAKLSLRYPEECAHRRLRSQTNVPCALQCTYSIEIPSVGCSYEVPIAAAREVSAGRR